MPKDNLPVVPCAVLMGARNPHELLSVVAAPITENIVDLKPEFRPQRLPFSRSLGLPSARATGGRSVRVNSSLWRGIHGGLGHWH